MTSMEIGMYVLLTAFCFAIVIFVISCVVYASKFRPINVESGLNTGIKDGFSNGILRESKHPRESTTNAHDWVWLGRSTLDRSSIVQDSMNGNIFDNPRDSRIKITSNPMNLNYADPDDAVTQQQQQQQQQVTSFDNATHIPMSYLCKPVNTETYNKNEKTPILNDNDIPPPLPPHGRSISNGNDNEYKPPVPPHRNVGVTANVINENGNDKENLIVPPVQKRHHHKHHRNSNNSHNHRLQCARLSENMDLILSYERPSDQYLNFTQENSPEKIFSSHDINSLKQETITDNRNNNSHNELHMAERLVETAAQQKKNAFQFDSLTPKRDPITIKTKSIVQDDIQIIPLEEENSDVKKRHKVSTVSTNNSSSDDNGGFVTPPEDKVLRKHQVKRATVVGNPMFSNTSDGEIGPGESLGLDDLDMDYEQIMHYFDNLKESNA